MTLLTPEVRNGEGLLNAAVSMQVVLLAKDRARIVNTSLDGKSSMWHTRAFGCVCVIRLGLVVEIRLGLGSTSLLIN